MAKFTKAEAVGRISVNPEIMIGKPVIRGTRIPVDLIVRLVAQGLSVKEIMEDYPRLTEADIRAALLVSEESVRLRKGV